MDQNQPLTLPPANSPLSSPSTRWYEGVTPYQWLILAIASAGWVFDVYEGQSFNITRNQLLADGFPSRARAHASGIFHATSVLGTWAATLAGLAVGSNWRYAYLVGVIPALLVAWVMASVKEPESWKRAGAKVQSEGGQMGSFRDLLTDPLWVQRALLGMLLAAVGLGTFWAVTVAGQDLAKDMLLRTGAPAAQILKRAQFAYGFVQTLGGVLG